MDGEPTADFETQAREAGETGILAEFWAFIAHNKKWWLLPLVAMLVLLGLLTLLAGSAAGPFIYTVF